MELLPATKEKIKFFCEKWKINEFAFFGSILTESYGPQSDIDILVSFHNEAHWSLFDFVRMKEELSKLMGRTVDLVSKRGLENSKNTFRKNSIFSHTELIHVS
ncbi:MAG: nucleotidyltransferase domain-containing protein [Deltaproteobacteria bacterium]|nr:MAG: nucleotidyltransferase domain-containing protein [Deltaproteobacteria bacterium]